MESSTKITLKSQMGHGAKYSLHKMTAMFQTVLKLALINGYDDQYRIRNKNGEFIANSNLLDLIHHAMSVGKNLVATNEFIDLLAEAGVEPEWLVNEHVKTMLRSKLMNRPTSLPLQDVHMVEQPPPALPQKPINPITTGAYWGPEKAEEKRKLATYKKPPPLKLAPRTTTPPTSPPSPFKKSFPPQPTFEQNDEPPAIDRMDVPPASPPLEMPRLKAMKRAREEDDDSDKENEPQNKRSKADLDELYNKSKGWELPDEDVDWD